ncbi:beta-ketoacyl synthase N-terminal-like domain-containing protein [Actinomadura yumaensis]|uniref:beta-ketoacyl synthase N-terminal-like domain-containing protein n=1 Tax=Actinomadura yumaensis TaxID=111807 RepID=UPI00361429EE
MGKSQTKVVVTGLGATTPLGGDLPSTWSALLAGKSGVRNLEWEGVEELPVRFAAQLAVEPSEVMTKQQLRRLDRNQAIALISAREAWRDAGLATPRAAGARTRPPSRTASSSTASGSASCCPAASAGCTPRSTATTCGVRRAGRGSRRSRCRC